MSEQALVQWITERMQEEDWGVNELARRADLSNAYVSNVLNGKQPPGLKFYKGIAQAFSVSEAYVMRLAGEISPAPGDTKDPSLLEWWEFGRTLTPEERSEAIRFAMWAFLGGRPRRPESRNPNEEESTPRSLKKAES